MFVNLEVGVRTSFRVYTCRRCKRAQHARRRAQASRCINHWLMLAQVSNATRRTTRRLLCSQHRRRTNCSFLRWQSTIRSRHFARKRAQHFEARGSALVSSRCHNLKCEAVFAWRKDTEWWRRVRGDVWRVMCDKRHQEVCTLHTFANFAALVFP